MTATALPTQTAPTATPAPAPAAGGARIRVMAIGLWGVVGSLLGYGVVMTVIKASALFTG